MEKSELVTLILAFIALAIFEVWLYHYKKKHR